MTEAEQRRPESPLQSDRGVTSINPTVVSTIAGMSAREVEGVHMGGSASRSAGGVLGNLTGSDSQTRGVTVEVGSVETALDLTMGIDYGKNILGTVGEVRQKVTERIQNMTGLKVTELNVTISDVVFPEDGVSTQTPTRSGPDFDTRASSRREIPSGEPETRQTETRQTEARQAERPSQIRERDEPTGSETKTESRPRPEPRRRPEGGSSRSRTTREEAGSGGPAPNEDETREIDRRSVSEGEESRPEERRSRRRPPREDG